MAAPGDAEAAYEGSARVAPLRRVGDRGRIRRRGERPVRAGARGARPLDAAVAGVPAADRADRVGDGTARAVGIRRWFVAVAVAVTVVVTVIVAARARRRAIPRGKSRPSGTSTTLRRLASRVTEVSARRPGAKAEVYTRAGRRRWQEVTAPRVDAPERGAAPGADGRSPLRFLCATCTASSPS